MKIKSKYWDSRVDEFKALASSGYTYKQIAQKMGETPQAITNAMRNRGLSLISLRSGL